MYRPATFGFDPCDSFRFTAWPQEALKSVARHFLDAVDMEEAVKAGVVDVCVDMQQRARDMAEDYRTEMGRYYYVTPTSYLELINTFKVTQQPAPSGLHPIPYVHLLHPSSTRMCCLG